MYKRQTLLRDFRDLIGRGGDILPKRRFTTIPKDVLLDRTRLSLILREQHHAFDTDLLIDGLFDKNHGLKGSADIHTSKPMGGKMSHFSEKAKTGGDW